MWICNLSKISFCVELKVNVSQSKSSIKSASSVGSSNFNPVQRKVAWQSDRDFVDTQSEQGSSQHGDNDDDECVKDSFQPPMFATEDSGNEYDTDLETEPPGRLNRILNLNLSWFRGGQWEVRFSKNETIQHKRLKKENAAKIPTRVLIFNN